MSTSPDASPEADPPEPAEHTDAPAGAPTSGAHDKPRKPRKPRVSRSRLSAAIRREAAAPLFLRAAAWGALAAAIIALAAALWLLMREGQEWDGAGRTGLTVVGMTAFVGPAFVSIKPGENRFGDNARIVTIAIASGVIAWAILHSWWQSCLERGDRPMAPVLLATATVLTGMSWIARTLRLILEEMRCQRALDDARADDAGLADAADSSRQPGGRHTWAVAIGGLCAPAVVVALVTTTALAFLPSRDLSVHATVSTAKPVSDDALPATPTGAPSQVAWKIGATSRSSDLESVPGTRGPIILSKGEVQGLNGEDGSLLWTYHVDNDGYIDNSKDSFGVSSQLRISPDHRHVAFIVTTTDRSFAAPPSGQSLVILDTMTGTPTATRTLLDGEATRGSADFETPFMQLTDSSALVGTDVISLADGTHLGTVPEEYGDTDLASGTAGHSTFAFSQLTDSENGYYRYDLTLVPDSDLSTSMSLTAICADTTNHNALPAILDGWVLHCGGDESAPRRDDDSAEPTVASWDISAINVDEASASGGSGDGSEISMGRGLGINRTASLAAGAPVTIPERSIDIEAYS